MSPTWKTAAHQVGHAIENCQQQEGWKERDGQILTMYQPGRPSEPMHHQTPSICYGSFAWSCKADS